jgi:hypothetical protein
MKKPPYEFVLDALEPLELRVKPMFGAYAVYHADKILMILRKKANADKDTGVWLGIPDEFVLEIKKEFPILKDLTLFGTRPTAWQVLRESELEFEETVQAFCKLIKKGDHRIGRIPKPKPIKKKSKIVPKKIKVKDNNR